jgi:cytidine deaminase
MQETNLQGKKFFKLTEAECQEMMRLADENLANCYPSSDDGFAVTVMTTSGKIYPGVSYNSDTGTLTMHSEMVALAHAALHGEKEVVAVTGPNCHICKQLLYENGLRSGIDINVILEDEANPGQYLQVPLSEMMPYPWPDKPTF